MSKRTIGDRLEHLIKTMAIKDYEFAEKYHISRASLIRYKQNERYPDPEFLLLLSKEKINCTGYLPDREACMSKMSLKSSLKLIEVNKRSSQIERLNRRLSIQSIQYKTYLKMIL